VVDVELDRKLIIEKIEEFEQFLKKKGVKLRRYKYGYDFKEIGGRLRKIHKALVDLKGKMDDKNLAELFMHHSYFCLNYINQASAYESMRQRCAEISYYEPEKCDQDPEFQAFSHIILKDGYCKRFESQWPRN